MGDFLIYKYINIKECLTAQAAGSSATSSFCMVQLALIIIDTIST